jgi:branched-chain amino acid transport system ATP-binding protein
MAEPLIRARGLRINFGGIIAADGVSLDVFNKERLAIIGPNGAGKTTFLNICTGYLKPMEGEVWFNQKEITNNSPRSITKRGVARTFQIPQLFLEHTVLENVLISVSARQGHLTTLRSMMNVPELEEAHTLLETMGIGDVAGQLAMVLPEGRRKLLDIALALALKPKVLLMDEPTSGVSSEEKFKIMDILVSVLDKEEITSVFVEHDMEVVSRYADRVVVWNQGRVQFDGVPDEILTHPEVIEQVVGMDVNHAAV